MVRDCFALTTVPSKNWTTIGFLFLCLFAYGTVAAAQDATPDIAPDAMPQIQQLTPNQATPGAHLTVTIQGLNFSAAATCSTASPAIHIDSFHRTSATQIEAHITVSDSASPGAASLMVANPSSASAMATLTIVSGQTPPAPGTAPAAPAPASPEAPSASPAPPASPQPPPNAAAPKQPAVPQPPQPPVETPAPEVTKVNPAKLGQGFDIDLKVIGNNFVQGTRVSCSNQGVRVLAVTTNSPTELTVHIKVLGDAPAGKTNLFIINPDDNEAEASIEVALKGTLTPPPGTVTPGSPGADPGYTQRFDAFHLASPTELFHVHGKVKGALVIAEGTVKYQEDNQTLVNISLSEIKEVKTAGIGGVNIKLNSGKTHHFAASSLKGSDARIIVNAIQKAMPAAAANQPQ